MAKTRRLIFLLSTLLWTPIVNAKNPNIVFILVDDMGYGNLSSDNAESGIPTPHLDRLAQQIRQALLTQTGGPARGTLDKRA